METEGNGERMGRRATTSAVITSAAVPLRGEKNTTVGRFNLMLGFSLRCISYLLTLGNAEEDLF